MHEESEERSSEYFLSPENSECQAARKDSVNLKLSRILWLDRCAWDGSFAPDWEGCNPQGRYKKVEFMKTIFVKPQSIEKKWYLIDAEGKTLGRVAAEAAKILRGKNKAEYVPHQDLGDYVIIINAAKASVTGNKMEDKIYYRHSMYPGGLKAESLKKMLDRKPTYPMEHAIKGMLPHGKLGRRLFTNVKIYAGPEHPHQAQQPIAVEM